MKNKIWMLTIALCCTSNQLLFAPLTGEAGLGEFDVDDVSTKPQSPRAELPPKQSWWHRNVSAPIVKVYQKVKENWLTYRSKPYKEFVKTTTPDAVLPKENPLSKEQEESIKKALQDNTQALKKQVIEGSEPEVIATKAAAYKLAMQREIARLQAENAAKKAELQLTPRGFLQASNNDIRDALRTSKFATISDLDAQAKKAYNTWKNAVNQYTRNLSPESRLQPDQKGLEQATTMLIAAIRRSQHSPAAEENWKILTEFPKALQQAQNEARNLQAQWNAAVDEGKVPLNEESPYTFQDSYNKIIKLKTPEFDQMKELMQKSDEFGTTPGSFAYLLGKMKEALKDMGSLEEAQLARKKEEQQEAAELAKDEKERGEKIVQAMRRSGLFSEAQIAQLGDAFTPGRELTLATQFGKQIAGQLEAIRTESGMQARFNQQVQVGETASTASLNEYITYLKNFGHNASDRQKRMETKNPLTVALSYVAMVKKIAESLHVTLPDLKFQGMAQ